MTHTLRDAPARIGSLPAVVALLGIIACGPATPPAEAPELPPAAGSNALPPEQEAFWAALTAHCGKAYGGTVSDATPHYQANVGRVAVIHFFDCTADRIHIPLHLDDDHSRNWILTRTGGTIRLKHDHRHADGTEDAISQYGGDAPVPGLATRQIFPADAHTAGILPDRADNFWFFDFVTPTTLQYGVHWPRLGHSVRFEFDLATPLPPPPAPWGYEPR
jgi:hypothetical protein